MLTLAKRSNSTSKIKKLWIVGFYTDCKTCGSNWALKGVYDSEEKAIKACVLDNYFIGLTVLNKDAPGGNDLVPWMDSYYPRLETREKGAKRAESEFFEKHGKTIVHSPVGT